MLVPTTISFIIGKNIIYYISSDEELLGDYREGDIYEEVVDKDKISLKISKIRYFNKGKFLIKIKQYKYELIFDQTFIKPVDLPKGLTHLKVKYNNKIIEIQNLPININHHDL